MKGGACEFNEHGEAENDNPCPGSLLLQNRNIVTPYDPETSVYILIGHSCDMIYDEKTVPENCIYVTKAICGVDSVIDKPAIDFIKDFSEGKEFLKDPVNNKAEFLKYKYKEGQNTYSESKYQDIHIHYPGAKSEGSKTFVNSKNTCFYRVDQVSGLYRIGAPIYNKKENSGFESAYPNSEWNENISLIQRTLNQYEHSLFPTKTDIENLLKSEQFHNHYLSSKILETTLGQITSNQDMEYSGKIENAIKKTFTVDTATILKYFPGVLYSISCRPVCRGDATNQNFTAKDIRVKIRREKSQTGHSLEFENISSNHGGSKKTKKRRTTKKISRKSKRVLRK